MRGGFRRISGRDIRPRLPHAATRSSKRGRFSVAYFQKTDSRQKVERSLATARASRDNLMERRKAAEASASELREKARQLAREGADDGALAKTESAMRAQQDRVVTLTAAIGDVERDIGEFEREVAAIVDTAMRAETSAAVTAMVERVERAESTFARAIQELED